MPQDRRGGGNGRADSVGLSLPCSVSQPSWTPWPWGTCPALRCHCWGHGGCEERWGNDAEHPIALGEALREKLMYDVCSSFW